MTDRTTWGSARLVSIAGLAILMLASCARQPEPAEVPVTTSVCRDGLIPPEFASGQSIGSPPSASAHNAGAGSARPARSASDLASLKACLEVEKTRLEAEKLQTELRNSAGELTGWGWLILVIQNFAIIAAVFGAFFAAWRYFEERRKMREESQSSRFDAVVAALGSDKAQAQVGGAALLPTFLERGFERFYVPVFKLAVAYLTPDEAAGRPNVGAHAGLPGGSGSRTRRIGGASPEAYDAIPRAAPVHQLLATVLKAAYPLALVGLIRERVKGVGEVRAPLAVVRFVAEVMSGQVRHLAPLSLTSRWTSERLVSTLSDRDALRSADEIASEDLSAEGIALDGVNLAAARFPLAWFRGASFRHADAAGIDLRAARLDHADFTSAFLRDARLPEAIAKGAVFRSARLRNANLRKIIAPHAIFDNARLQGAKFDGAELEWASFKNARFGSSSDKDESTIHKAASLHGADFQGATGLNAEQIRACRELQARNLPDL